MQRFTISLDETLAAQFDEFIAERAYDNRSEAVRDLIRAKLGGATLQPAPPGAQRDRHAAQLWCVATVSYIFDHREPTATARLLDLLHDHHDLVVTALRTHLDHDDCMETAVLRGPLDAVKACAESLVALRGIRHGNIHLVPLDTQITSDTHPHSPASGHGHGHAHSPSSKPHSHLHPHPSSAGQKNAKPHTHPADNVLPPHLHLKPLS